MSKITDYAALASVQSDDVLPIVDVHDTTMASSGTTKKITVGNLVPALPVSIANGGTGAATQQAAISALTGAQSAGKYLRSDGTNAALASIAAGDVPTLNQNTTGTAAGLSTALAVGSGGTGQTTQQAAINALTGTQSAGKVLRSDGTNATLAAIQAADVPTLNQSTTGTAANVTGTVAVANGGTGQVTQQAAVNALTGVQSAGKYLRSDGTNSSLASIQAADVPVLNQNTTGTAANVTGIVALANGGTGTNAASANAAFNALSPLTTLGDLLYGGTSGSGTRLAGDTSNTRKFLRGQSAGGVAAAPAWDTLVSGDIPNNGASTTGTAANVTGVVALANGGTGQVTQQAALDALAGAVTSGLVLRGNGTHVLMASLQAGDIPDLAYVDTVTAADSSVTISGAADTPTVASVPAQLAQRILCV